MRSRLPVEAPTTVAASPTKRRRTLLRSRLLRGGPDGLTDCELLEMVLHIAVPWRDTKPLAYGLLARFGSFAATLVAPSQELRSVEGIGEAGIASLKVVIAAALRLAQPEPKEQPVLGDWDRIMAYLDAIPRSGKNEQYRVLFLDNRNRLIADEVQGHGAVALAPKYYQQVSKRVLETTATGIILVQIRPNGELSPSPEDVAMTRELKAVTSAIGAAMYDHVILGNGSQCSLRQRGLL
jgi:DNA repair protein RadC